MSDSINYFSKLSAINVADYIEKKGQFSYLSWPFAVSQLRQCDPTATWEVKRFNGLPYLTTELGVFVEVAVTVQGITLSQIHPVMDGRNRPIMAPSSFDINTSIQRCLVKAIALHGLGLNIYAGEDLPLIEGNENSVDTKQDGSDKPLTTPVPKVTSFPPASRADKVTDAQIRYINKLIAESCTDLDKVLAYFGVEHLDDIPKSEASRVIRSLDGRRQLA